MCVCARVRRLPRSSARRRQVTCIDSTARYTAVGAEHGAVIVYAGGASTTECTFKATGFARVLVSA